MGIIIRQSVKTTIVNFVGVGIAALSTLFIYPQFEEIYGFAQFLIGTATLLVPFASLGVANTVIKFYPKFKTSDRTNHGLLSMLLIAYLAIYSIALFLLLIFQSPLLDWLQSIGLDKNRQLPEFIVFISVISGLMILNHILISYATSNKRIVVPQVISQLGIKIFMPLAILILGTFTFSKATFALWLICFYMFVSIMMICYLIYLRVFKLVKPNWKILKNNLGRKIFQYSIFSSWNQIGGMLAFRIDTVMIPILMPGTVAAAFSSNGIYAMMLFLSNIIVIPAKSIAAIASPIISESWENNNQIEIRSIYKKSALNLVIPGLAFSLFLWFSFDGIAGISSNPQKLMIGKYAFLFLGIGKLLDLITSINGQIIIYSPKYKYNLIFILILGILNVILNYYLIKDYGITGAAIASSIAYAVYNAIKLIFLKLNYNMHPFTLGLFKVLIVGVLLGLILHFLPVVSFSLGEIFLNGLIILLLYFPIIYFFNISPDFNNLCKNILLRIKNFI